MVAIARIAAEQGSFSRIRQVAPICTPSNPWANASLPRPHIVDARGDYHYCRLPTIKTKCHKFSSYYMYQCHHTCIAVLRELHCVPA